MDKAEQHHPSPLNRSPGELAMIGIPAGMAIGLNQVDFGLQVPLIAACCVFIIFGVLGLIRRWPTSVQAERSHRLLVTPSAHRGAPRRRRAEQPGGHG